MAGVTRAQIKGPAMEIGILPMILAKITRIGKPDSTTARAGIKTAKDMTIPIGMLPIRLTTATITGQPDPIMAMLVGRKAAQKMAAAGTVKVVARIETALRKGQMEMLGAPLQDPSHNREGLPNTTADGKTPVGTTITTPGPVLCRGAGRGTKRVGRGIPVVVLSSLVQTGINTTPTKTAGAAVIPVASVPTNGLSVLPTGLKGRAHIWVTETKGGTTIVATTPVETHHPAGGTAVMEDGLGIPHLLDSTHHIRPAAAAAAGTVQTINKTMGTTGTHRARRKRALRYTGWQEVQAATAVVTTTYRAMPVLLTAHGRTQTLLKILGARWITGSSRTAIDFINRILN